MYSSGSNLRSSQISYHLHCVFHSPFVATNTSSTPNYNYMSTRVQLQLFKRTKVNSINQLLPASCDRFLAVVVVQGVMGRGHREGSWEGLKKRKGTWVASTCKANQLHRDYSRKSEKKLLGYKQSLCFVNDSNPGEIMSQADWEKDRRLGWLQPRKKQYVSVTSLCAFKLEGVKDCLAMQFAVGR